MGVDTRLVAVLLLVTVPPIVFTQNTPTCDYMVQIPRPESPVFPDQDLSGQTWSQRPLLPILPRRPDLCMEQTFTANTQIIYMEEEIVGEITIARFNYHGTVQPVFRQMSGSLSQLGPVARRVDDNSDTPIWDLIITQRQDFEMGMHMYMFTLVVEGQTLTPTVALQIVNIDDNPPVLEVFDPCEVDELGDPRLTTCVYRVTDRDGEISTSVMRFEVDSDRGDETIFRMVGANVPNDWFTMTMTVELLTPLNFETNALHVFSVTAYDSLPNNQTVNMMVRVQNVPHRPPRWVEIFAVQQFDEKTVQQFPLRAIDGDDGIVNPISYTLIRDEADTFFSLETLEGGLDGAILHVDKIDRDLLQRELFQLTVIASKHDNASLATEANIVIIVNDVNDQWPLPLHPQYEITIREETPLTLNLEEFGFHDLDLGENAQYTVRLEDEYPPGAASAFQINPNVGYQRQTFIMNTVNHTMLDYEVPEFQNIIIKVIATDMNRTDFIGEALIYITLENWNDELPIFEETSYTASFNETVGKGFAVGSVLAVDRDIDDRVVHTLMGNAGQFLSINESSGEIIVSVDDAFDYHRQNVILVQVRADDTLGEPFNTVTTQLTIELEDVNNTPPTLRLPRGTPSVEENVPEGYVITSEIRATDPDTTADLVFEIDWETTWAAKQGRETPRVEFENCVDIETVYPNEGDHGTAIGRLVVKEIRTNVTIDFEEFEVLYLAVRVRDLNTVLGEDTDESTFTITIIDMNDNWPIFAAGSLEQALRVQELSASGVVIGSVLATDIDGPLYNQVRYTIVAINDTPEGLVRIDFTSGQITVDQTGAISADVPPRYYLYYTVTASDECYAQDPAECPPDPTYWRTEGNITIEIIDTNNQSPVAETDLYLVQVPVWENAPSGTNVVLLHSSDLDRDEIYNTVRYTINYAVNPRLRVFFSVEPDSGQVYVYYTTDEVLDRDGDEPTHTIFLTLIDNFNTEGDGRRNQYETQIEVILLDENDNRPILQSPDVISWDESEALEGGIQISPILTASDRDEPDSDNTRIGYAVANITAVNRPGLVVPDLFDMIQLQNVSGELETAMPFRGYWGTYDVVIHAFDHGIPQQHSYETYRLTIRPYNFHEPVFVFPLHETTVRLAREWATVGGQLTTVAGPLLDRVSATDEDGLHAGVVTFHIQGNEEATQFFDITNDGDNGGVLTLRQMFDEDIRQFRITIRATDGGTEPGPLFTDSTLIVVYVPTMGDPTFSVSTASAPFREGEDGLSESFSLPRAEDRKNYACVPDRDCLDIFYRIIEGNDEGFFTLDPSRNVVRLSRALDREAAATHTFRVAASNSPDATNTPLQASVLTVTVNVREANPRPIFERQLYSAGISTLDSIGRELLTVRARHSDNDVIRYTIDQDSMTIDSSLEAVRDTAFVLQQGTGVLTLNMQPTAAMHGMFQFQVLATDTAGETDRTQVQIYLISSLNRVFFLFYNTLDQIESNRDFIAQTFTTGFSMLCNIDQVVPASGDDGNALDDRTEVRAHFIRDDAPVSAAVIEELRSDTVLLRNIQNTLNTELLVLQDFVTGQSPDSGSGSDATQTAVYVLGALSALLALMCVVLLLTFVFRTRALNRRLQALSMTKYGSVDSGLNRAGLAPGTNKHAVEGSNPIWNEAIKAPDFDALSDGSGDSDLIGIEDLPQFRDDYFPPGDTDSLDEIFNPRGGDENIATHGNNFGFNTSPFSPGFTNNQFRR